VDREPWPPRDGLKPKHARSGRLCSSFPSFPHGRHTGNSLMRDAGVDQEIRMREVGHSDRDVNSRYTHIVQDAHLAAAEQVAALVS
jgi:integrase